MIQTELISLPLSLHRGTGFVIVAFAVFMVAAHTGIAALAAQRTSLSLKKKVVVPFVIGAFLASWFALAAVAADGSNFPIAAESRRPVSGLVAVIPFVIAVVALFASKSIRAINAATPSSWLIAVQTYRVAGIMFIFPFLLTESCRPVSAGRGNRRCPDWDLRASCGVNGGAKPTECFQMGGSLECFRHARPDCRSRHCALFSVAGSCSLSARVVPLFARTATGEF